MKLFSWMSRQAEPEKPWTELAANCGVDSDRFDGLTFTFHGETLSSTPATELEFYFSPSFTNGAAKIAVWGSATGSQV